MRRFLLFRLEAPLAAMGDVAVGERRYGADRPAKSAVVGLLAAALGITRAEEEASRRLAEGFGVAVRPESGVFLEDYHTVQAPAARRGRSWPTRRAELRNADIETLVSLREYRCDAAATVALWPREGAPCALEELARALERPHFVLYFGRKACPLSRPPAPLVLEAASLAEAFARFDAQDGETGAAVPTRRRNSAGRAPAPPDRIFADADCRDWCGDGLLLREVGLRRDLPASRRGWQFELREELMLVVRNGEGQG